MLLRMLRRIFITVAITCCGLAAAEPAPHVLLKSVTVEVIEILKQSRGNFSPARGAQAEELVERKIVPIFDFRRMTEIAMDGNWRLATPPQRNALVAEFTTLLVRTYAVAIRNYRDETFDFSLVSGAGGAREATVRSVVRQGAAVLATIDYDMQNRAEGWKVYEIRLDGINLIANYRRTFAARVRDGGVDGLIKTLADKNRQSNYSGAPSRAASPDDPK
jgi:phospholipid transport system substrate-binding protein